MKIATLTFHRALNYGAVLQTYALQKILLKRRIDTEVLDYRSKFIENHYEQDKISNYYTLRKVAILFLRNGCSIVKREQFTSFLKNNIKISPQKYNKEDLGMVESKYDIFLVGSDQVWNYRIAGFDKTYFLDFVKSSCKKASYAASIGLDIIPIEYEKEYKNLLQSFGRISVRENEGQKLLERLLDRRDIETVVDPTLLLQSSEWEKLSEKCEIPEKYLLLYLLSENRKILKFAKKIAKKYKCKIIYINNQLLKRCGMINRRDTTPENWLYLFKNADYIVTNSFHGTIFSIIFKKIFWVDYLHTSSNVNSRIITLLCNLGLKDRIISEGCDVNHNEINYSDVEELLANIVDKSNHFLDKIINDE